MGRAANVRIAVTGATGYIGGQLASRLAQEGHELSAIVRPTSNVDLVHALAPGVRVLAYTGNTRALAHWLAEGTVEVVMHLAAHQDQSDSLAAVEPLVESNVVFTAELAAAAAHAKAQAFVNTGSFSQHLDGSRRYVPASLYAATKQAARDVLEYYRSATDMRCVTLELSDVYGPADPRPKFLNALHAAALAGEPLEATPGDQLVSFVHVSDVTAAYTAVAQALVDGAELDAVYSVACPPPISLRDAVDIWCTATGRHVEVRWGARPHAPRQVMRPYLHDPPPGWEPRVSPEAGFARVYGDPNT